jgi:hypothetical protein
MKKRKIFLFTFVILLSIVVFSLSFRWTYNKLNSNKLGSHISNESYQSMAALDTKITDSTNILLKLKVKDNNHEYVVETLKLNDIKSLFNGSVTVKSLEDYYSNKDYKLTSASNKQVVLTKESKFEPNMYYLGATDDGYITVFKCDKSGILCIENLKTDKSQKKLDTLPDQDIKYIKNYDYKFDNKNSALDELSGMCS